MDSRELAKKLWEVLPAPIEQLGFELIEIECVGRSPQLIVRLFLDKPGGGITLDDCAKASRALSPLLDDLDPVPDRYLLEVSSPGIDRPLRRVADFTRYAGEAIKLSTVAPHEGRSRFKGTLIGFEDGLIEIEVDGHRYRLHIENLKKANLDR